MSSGSTSLGEKPVEPNLEANPPTDTENESAGTEPNESPRKIHGVLVRTLLDTRWSDRRCLQPADLSPTSAVGAGRSCHSIQHLSVFSRQYCGRRHHARRSQCVWRRAQVAMAISRVSINIHSRSHKPLQISEQSPGSSSAAQPSSSLSASSTACSTPNGCTSCPQSSSTSGPPSAEPHRT